MAGDAAVFAVSHQMIVGRGHLLPDIIVAPQAGIDSDRDPFSDMAVAAPGGIRLVQDVADQVAVVAAVRAVTGSAVFHLGGEIRMLLLDDALSVAPQAEVVSGLDEQCRIGRLMRFMAIGASALGKGSMSELVLPGNGVARKTDLGGSRVEKMFLVRRMGSMAGNTLPFPNGSVDDRLFHILQFRVTGIAEPGDIPLEKPLVTGEMGIVTGGALPLNDGVVPDLFLESRAVVAGEAVHGSQGLSRGERQKKYSTHQSETNRVF
jgi:hypothetical protein